MDASASPLDEPVQFLKGVGPARAEVLRRLGILTVRDLLFHFPRAYEDLSDVRPIAQLTANATVTVQGEVVEIDGKQLPDGRTIVSVVISDNGRDCLEGAWFNQTHIARRFRYGQRVAFSGKATWFRDRWRMANPRVQDADASNPATPGVVPVYPLTEDLRPDTLRALLRQTLPTHAGHVPEVLPDALRTQHGLPEVRQALNDIHFPATLAAGQTARRRFVYEELLLLQVALGVRRRDLRDRQRARSCRSPPPSTSASAGCSRFSSPATRRR